ncbi:DUF397 domain-containing protein (plasmid) [Microtetraspora malaysiensis]|uniref:DUF397 domain-containing protein n=1 Tax=Microtetraspora malaysiensis TaxID=161358 RepID=UPI003D89B695
MLTENWRTASESGSCVAVRRDMLTGDVLVCDTKDDGKGPVLAYTPAEWWAFKRGMVAGMFDLPEWNAEPPRA